GAGPPARRCRGCAPSTGRRTSSSGSVASGRSVVGELAPEAVGRLLLGGQAVQGAGAQFVPLLVGQHPPGQGDGGGGQGQVVGRGADVWPLVAREVDAAGRLAGEPADDFADLLSPASAALSAQLGLEQAVGVEPEVDLPLVVLLVLGGVLLAEAGEQ